MFGFVTTNASLLEKAETDRYQAFYCGLCRALGRGHGSAGRMTLTYDMAFLTLLLSSAHAMPESHGTLHCPVNPLRTCAYIATAATGYAADINVLLAYHKAIDDWTDDHSVSAAGRKMLLAGKAEQAAGRWPRQNEAILRGLSLLSEMEKADERNPDLPANCFGELLGELFVLDTEAPLSQPLRQVGASLGRFLYIMDACMDLRADIKKGRYNPLISLTESDFEPILTVLIGNCTQTFESMALSQDVRLLRNILYSGVWVKYKSKFKKEGNAIQHDRSL